MRLINIDLYLRKMKEGSDGEKDLEYFADRWGVTPGLVARWRSGAKRIGVDKAPVVFADLEKFRAGWTMTAYFKQWKAIHARYVEKKRKLDAWLLTPSEDVPCGQCGDAQRDHGPRGCTRCEVDCRKYEAWVRRGRRMGSKKKVREGVTGGEEERMQAV